MIVFLLVGAVVMYLSSLLAAQSKVTDILSNKSYWLSVGVANGLIHDCISCLCIRVDAQNIALARKRFGRYRMAVGEKVKKTAKNFRFTTIDRQSEQDGRYRHRRGEKGRTALRVITTSQLHALIVGTTGSGKTTGFVDQNIAVLGKSKGKPSIVISDPKKELLRKARENA